MQRIKLPTPAVPLCIALLALLALPRHGWAQG